jgi:hypothetical protein
METAPLVTRLWDYGWLGHDTVKLQAAVSDAALIEQYVASSAFHTSILPSDKDETGIHGPFLANGIGAGDFLPLTETELENYLKTIEFSVTPGADDVARDKMLTHLSGAFQGGKRCFILRRDERDKELFHDWGFVLLVFREFLFIGSARDRLDRFFIGYD